MTISVCGWVMQLNNDGACREDISIDTDRWVDTANLFCGWIWMMSMQSTTVRL